MKQGDKFGAWQLVGILGRGGNAEVWEATSESGETAAIKLLRRDRRSRDRLARFREEISFFQRPNPHPGVLPVLDSLLPDDVRQPAWLVMPIATRLRDSLGTAPRIEAVVEAISTIAETLADLAETGVGHRDIKPDNLYEMDGRFLVGDFGLVTYPEKEPMTVSGRRLGPVDYMAPEMRDAADTASPEPADVYALAKSMWVLAVDRELPLPGPHRVDDPAYSLAENLSGNRLAALDVVLERATAVNPVERIHLARFAAELRAWQTGGQSQPSAPPDMSKITAKLSTVVQPAVRTQERLNHVRRAANEGFAALKDGPLREVFNHFGAVAAGNAGLGTRSGIPTPYFRREPSTPRAIHRDHWGAMLGMPASERFNTELVCNVGVQVFEDGIAKFGAAFVMSVEGQWASLWQTEREVPAGSPAQALAITELGDEIREQTPRSLEALVEAIEVGHLP